MKLLLGLLPVAFLLLGCIETAPQGTVPQVDKNGQLVCPLDASESVDSKGNPICITPRPRGPTIQINNEGLESVRVGDPYGRIATVLPGQKSCVAMVRSYITQINLYLSAIGDSAVTPSFLPSDAPGWVLEISSMPLRFSAISLQPAEPCVPKP